MTQAGGTGERARSRLRVAVAAVTAATALVVGICGYSALARVGKPFPGFFVWENGFVPAVGLPTWSGAAAGLEYHSWILSVQDHPLESAASIDATIAGSPTGSPVRYLTRHGMITREITVPSAVFGLNDFVASTGVFLFDSTVLLLLAATLFYVGFADPGARAVGMFALVQALYLATSIDLFGPYRFRVFYFFFAGLTPTATFFMISRFPVERPISRIENQALTTALMASLLFGLLSNVFFKTNPAGLLFLDRAVHIGMAISALSAFAFFTWHFLRGRTDAVRRRCQVVLLASMGGFLPTMVLLLAFYVGGLSLPFNFLAVPFVLFPIGIGYAVAKHDLFDVDTVVKRTIVYTALSTGILSAYTIAISTFDLMFESVSPIVSRLAEGVVIVVLILLFDPSRRRLQEVVNRLYDRRRWVYRDVVRSSVRAFSTILDIETLLPAVLGLVDESVQPTFACVYTIAEGAVPRFRGGLLHSPGSDGSIEVDRDGVEAPEFASLARLAAERESLSTLDADGPVLAAFGASMALGLALEGKATGLLLIGPRRSGGLYTREDVDLLRTIAGQLAVAMENAESYRTIDTLNRDLAGKNRQLGDALHDLREAQSELIVRERLAAVGEIAGAVAHTIRNPLAGMRAAAQQAHIELADHPVAELVHYFVRETDRLSSRIDSLLDFARPFHVAPRPSCLATIVRQAAAQVRGRAMERGIAIDENGGTAEIPVTVDPDLFEQLSIELIANAVDASPDGSRVCVTVGQSSAAAFLEVQDQGPGIPADRQERMFRMFFTTKPKGTGIGLATVKRIADAHKASIEVNGAPGGGACFRVVLEDSGRGPAADSGDETKPPDVQVSYLDNR